MCFLNYWDYLIMSYIVIWTSFNFSYIYKLLSEQKNRKISHLIPAAQLKEHQNDNSWEMSVNKAKKEFLGERKFSTTLKHVLPC